MLSRKKSFVQIGISRRKIYDYKTKSWRKITPELTFLRTLCDYLQEIFVQSRPKKWMIIIILSQRYLENI